MNSKSYKKMQTICNAMKKTQIDITSYDIYRMFGGKLFVSTENNEYPIERITWGYCSTDKMDKKELVFIPDDGEAEDGTQEIFASETEVKDEFIDTIFKFKDQIFYN